MNDKLVEKCHFHKFLSWYPVVMGTSDLLHAKLNENGRLVIPVSMRQALGFEPGDDLLLIIEDDELRVTTVQKRVKRAQKLVREHARIDGSVVDELIADRRRQAAGE